MIEQVKLLGCFNVYNQKELLNFYKTYGEAIIALKATRYSIEHSINNHDPQTWGYKNYKWKWFYIDSQDFISCLKDPIPEENRPQRDLFVVCQNDDGDIKGIYRNRSSVYEENYSGDYARRAVLEHRKYKKLIWKYQDIDKPKLINLVNEKVKNNEIYL